MVNLQDCTAQAPTNCDLPSDLTGSIPSPPGHHDTPSSCTPQAFQHEISLLIHEMLSLGANQPDFVDVDAVSRLHSMVDRRVDALSPIFRARNATIEPYSPIPHLHEKRQQIRVTANNFLLALHRQHARTELQSREAAMCAALEILDAQQALFEAMGDKHYKCYMLSYYTIDAGIFLATLVAKHPPSDPKQAHAVDVALQRSIERLTWMVPRNKMAASAIPILEQHISRAGRRDTELVAAADDLSQASAGLEQASQPTTHTLSQNGPESHEIVSLEPMAFDALTP